MNLWFEEKKAQWFLDGREKNIKKNLFVVFEKKRTKKPEGITEKRTT